MKTLLIILFSLFSLSAMAQSANNDPLYYELDQPRKSKLDRLEKRRWRQTHPLFVNKPQLVAGVAAIGAGVGIIGISNAVISNKTAKLDGFDDADKIENYAKLQRTFNYVGGGLGVVGCVLSLTSIKRDRSGDYILSKKFTLKNDRRGLTIAFRLQPSERKSRFRCFPKQSKMVTAKNKNAKKLAMTNLRHKSNY